MRKAALLAVAATLSIFLAVPASAQDRAGKFSLNPFVGGYVFEGNQDLEHSLAAGLGLGYNFTENVGAEASFAYINSESTRGDVDVPCYLGRVELLYHFMPGNNFQPYLAVGAGGLVLDPDDGDSDTRFIIDGGGGLEYFIAEDIALRADLRAIQAFDDDNINFMYTGGLTFYFGPGKAPVAPAPAPPMEEAKAPAPRPVVPAAVPETCIDLAVQFDFDKSDIKPEFKDEIKKAADYLRAHPKSRGTIQGYTDAVGSEEYNAALGLRRAEAVKKYLVDEFGIPVGRLRTESFGKAHPLSTNLTEEGRAENRRAVRIFCSESDEAVQPVKPKVCLGLKVEFETGRWDVRPQFRDEIRKVADYMKEHPGMTGTIEGYTDSVGSDESNMKLSVKRAEAVKQYLVGEFGISPDRLKTVGLGSARPIADNSTPEGRAANRYAAEVFCEPAE